MILDADQTRYKPTLNMILDAYQTRYNQNNPSPSKIFRSTKRMGYSVQQKGWGIPFNGKDGVFRSTERMGYSVLLFPNNDTKINGGRLCIGV